MRNPLSYTNRTYSTFMSELELLYPNKPVWFKEVMSGMMDNGHWYLDARANNVLIISAYTEESVNANAQMLDYYPSTRSASGLTVNLELGSAGPYTIAKEDLTFSIISEQGDTLAFSAIEDINVPNGDTEIEIGILNLLLRASIPLGSSDGTSAWQEFAINDLFVLQNPPPVLSIGVDSWTNPTQNTLVNSGPTAKVYKLIRKPNGIVSCQTGDGVMGAIPPNGLVLGSYYTGGGTAGNINTANAQISYTGADSRISGVTFVSARSSGGSDGDSMEKTRFLAPMMLRTNWRAVTEEDDVVVAMKYDSSIIRAKSIPGFYGEGTVALFIIPAGGGNPSTPLKTGLEAYMKPRVPPSKNDVRARGAIYATRNAEMGIKLRSGYLWSIYQYYTKLVLQLILSEKTFELVGIFSQYGVAAAISYINSIWGYTFGVPNYSVIYSILQRRIAGGINDWGTTTDPNEMISAVDALPGVETETIVTPTTPQSTAFYQITTEGTVTTTEL